MKVSRKEIRHFIAGLLPIFFVFGTTGISEAKEIVKSRCPNQCICFSISKMLSTSPPTYRKVQNVDNGTLIAVSCKRQQLTTVPVGMGREAAVIILSYNDITTLNRSAFEGLHGIQAIDLSHNKISSIANDTFDDLIGLEQLDLSYNQMQTFPTGSFCPWFRQEYGLEEENSGCNSWIRGNKSLRLIISHNAWHCNCHLQEFIEEYSCAYDETACISFTLDLHDPIGYCVSPEHMRHQPLISLSSSRTESGAKNIDVCKHRVNKVDVPLLVTIFSWMGAVLGYVVYFISWNNRDIANHRSYLSTLNFQANSHADEKTNPELQLRKKSIASTAAGTPRHSFQTKHRIRPPIVKITRSSSAEVWVPRYSPEYEQEPDDNASLKSDSRITDIKPGKNDRLLKVEDRGPELILRPSETTDMFRSSSL